MTQVLVCGKVLVLNKHVALTQVLVVRILFCQNMWRRRRCLWSQVFVLAVQRVAVTQLFVVRFLSWPNAWRRGGDAGACGTS